MGAVPRDGPHQSTREGGCPGVSPGLLSVPSPTTGAWRVGWGESVKHNCPEWNQRSEAPGPAAWHLGAQAVSHGRAGAVGDSAGGSLVHELQLLLQEWVELLLPPGPALVEMVGESRLVLVHPAPPVLKPTLCWRARSVFPYPSHFCMFLLTFDMRPVPSPEPWRGFGASVRLRCSGGETLKCFVYFLY